MAHTDSFPVYIELEGGKPISLGQLETIAASCKVVPTLKVRDPLVPSSVKVIASPGVNLYRITFENSLAEGTYTQAEIDLAARKQKG
jgi:hypothetical protein